MDAITPPIGRILDTGLQRCGFSPGDTDETTCNEPATWHICWEANMENGLACDAHMAHAQRYAYLDRHKVVPDCTMPGCMWDFDGKRCTVPGTDEPATATTDLLVDTA